MMCRDRRRARRASRSRRVVEAHDPSARFGHCGAPWGGGTRPAWRRRVGRNCFCRSGGPDSLRGRRAFSFVVSFRDPRVAWRSRGSFHGEDRRAGPPLGGRGGASGNSGGGGAPSSFRDRGRSERRSARRRRRDACRLCTRRAGAKGALTSSRAGHSLKRPTATALNSPRPGARALALAYTHWATLHDLFDCFPLLARAVCLQVQRSHSFTRRPHTHPTAPMVSNRALSSETGLQDGAGWAIPRGRPPGYASRWVVRRGGPALAPPPRGWTAANSKRNGG